MTWKSYAAASGAGLLATYLFSSPPTIAPGRSPDRPDPISRAIPPSQDIQDQAERLTTRVRQETQYQTPSRNPFRFGAREAVPTTAPDRGAVAAPDPVIEIPAAPAPPPPPPIRLSGITANTVDGTRQRAAVLITLEGVVTAREGDMIGVYRIVRVEEDAVEIAGPDGATRRLNLRP